VSVLPFCDQLDIRLKVEVESSHSVNKKREHRVSALYDLVD
jgi:hypothetical protein